MDQKGLLDEEEGKSTGDEFEGFEETPKASKKGNKNLLLGGLLLIIVALAANFFLLKKEEPVVPPAPVRIPIKEAPVTAVEEVPMVEAKAEVKPEVKPEAGAKEGLVVIIGTYAAKYEAEVARAKLKGIPHKVKETKKKLMMYRIIAKEVRDKDEANAVVSGLKENGYDPFVVRKNDLYKVYAASNANVTISKANMEDLEKLGYLPVVEKGNVKVKVYQVIADSKSEEDAKALSGVLTKLGFKPEINK